MIHCLKKYRREIIDPTISLASDNSSRKVVRNRTSWKAMQHPYWIFNNLIHFRKWSIWKALWLAEKSCTLGTGRSGLNSQLCNWLTLCPWASHLASLCVYFLPGKIRRIIHKDSHLTKMCRSCSVTTEGSFFLLLANGKLIFISISFDWILQKEHETTTNLKESFNPLIYAGVLLQYILLCVNIFNARRRACRSCIYKNICCLNLLECQLCSLVLSTAEPTKRIEDEILERRGLHIRNN